MDKGYVVSLEKDGEVKKAPHTAACGRPWFGVWLPQENIPAVASLETRSSLSSQGIHVLPMIILVIFLIYTELCLLHINI